MLQVVQRKAQGGKFVSLGGCGFLNLNRQLLPHLIEPLALVGKNRTICHVVGHLVPNQIGMDDKKSRREEQLAVGVFAAEKVFRHRDNRGRAREAENESDLLPERISGYQENCNGQKRNHGEENEAWFRRGKENGGSASADTPGYRRSPGHKFLRQESG